MRQALLSIGYTVIEQATIRECFLEVIPDIEIAFCQSEIEALQELQSKKVDCFIVHPRMLDSLPFVSFLRSIHIPIVLLPTSHLQKMQSTWLKLQCVLLNDSFSDDILESANLTIIRAGDLELCLEHRSAVVCGSKLQLTPKEFDILSLLISNPRYVFTYEMIIDNIWHEDYDFYSQRAIHHHISNINRKINQAGGTRKYIKSIYGMGYQFDV